MYKIEWTKSAEKDLKKLSKPEGKRIYDKVGEVLSNSPHKYELMQGLYSGHRKFRVGNYRIIFKINEQIVTVEVIKVGHRSDVYKIK